MFDLISYNKFEKNTKSINENNKTKFLLSSIKKLVNNGNTKTLKHTVDKYITSDIIIEMIDAKEIFSLCRDSRNDLSDTDSLQILASSEQFCDAISMNSDEVLTLFNISNFRKMNFKKQIYYFNNGYDAGIYYDYDDTFVGFDFSNDWVKNYSMADGRIEIFISNLNNFYEDSMGIDEEGLYYIDVDYYNWDFSDDVDYIYHELSNDIIDNFKKLFGYFGIDTNKVEEEGYIKNFIDINKSVLVYDGSKRLDIYDLVGDIGYQKAEKLEEKRTVIYDIMEVYGFDSSRESIIITFDEIMDFYNKKENNSLETLEDLIDNLPDYNDCENMYMEQGNETDFTFDDISPFNISLDIDFSDMDFIKGLEEILYEFEFGTSETINIKNIKYINNILSKSGLNENKVIKRNVDDTGDKYITLQIKEINYTDKKVNIRRTYTENSDSKSIGGWIHIDDLNKELEKSLFDYIESIKSQNESTIINFNEFFD